MPMAWLRRAIALLGFGGAALFAAAFLYSFVNPGQVEQRVRVAIEAEVRARVGAQLGAIDQAGLSAMARRLSSESTAKVDHARQQLREGLPARVAEVAARMRDPACGCRDRVEAGVTGWLAASIASGEELQASLESLIRSKYEEVAGQVLREFRIFTGINAAVLLLLGIAVAARPRAGVQLLPAALVLAAASTVTGYLYLFQQDWLHTLLFGDYVGFWYFGYLAAAALLLGDLLLNRARITAKALTVVLGVLGTAVSVLPC